MESYTRRILTGARGVQLLKPLTHSPFKKQKSRRQTLSSNVLSTSSGVPDCA